MSDASFFTVELVDYKAPKGWIICNFVDLFDIKGGSQPPKSEFSAYLKPGYIRLLQIRDFDSDEFAVYSGSQMGAIQSAASGAT